MRRCLVFVNPCDHTSFGQIIAFDRHIVMIQRNDYPYGAFALPAGHLDGGEWFEIACRKTRAESGIEVVGNKDVWEKEIQNPCSRPGGGSNHLWKVFKALSWKGTIKALGDAGRCLWVTPAELRALAGKTEYFINKYQTDFPGPLTLAIFGEPNAPNADPEWAGEKMGLEPVWYFILKELKMI